MGATRATLPSVSLDGLGKKCVYLIETIYQPHPLDVAGASGAPGACGEGIPPPGDTHCFVPSGSGLGYTWSCWTWSVCRGTQGPEQDGWDLLPQGCGVDTAPCPAGNQGSLAEPQGRPTGHNPRPASGEEPGRSGASGVEEGSLRSAREARRCPRPSRRDRAFPRKPAPQPRGLGQVRGWWAERGGCGQGGGGGVCRGADALLGGRRFPLCRVGSGASVPSVLPTALPRTPAGPAPPPSPGSGSAGTA